MNVDYKWLIFTTNLTENFTQTNWWVTSFTPKEQSPNVNLLSAKFDFGFAANYGGNCNTVLFNALKNTVEHNRAKWPVSLISFHTSEQIYKTTIELSGDINDL